MPKTKKALDRGDPRANTPNTTSRFAPIPLSRLRFSIRPDAPRLEAWQSRQSSPFFDLGPTATAGIKPFPSLSNPCGSGSHPASPTQLALSKGFKVSVAFFGYQPLALITRYCWLAWRKHWDRHWSCLFFLTIYLLTRSLRVEFATTCLLVYRD